MKVAERAEISRGLGAGLSLRTIARHLLRALSTISREVRRWLSGQRAMTCSPR
ncbi:MAG: helix-turn-helix domain-containing protein [Roseobacter sp.]